MGGVTSRIVLAVRHFGNWVTPTTSGWYGLVQSLRSLGLEIADQMDIERATHLLVIDYVRRDELNWPDLPSENKYLIATECVTVNPWQFRKKLACQFSRIFVPSDRYPTFENSIVWEGGYFSPTRFQSFLANDGNRFGCAMVNENKFSAISESNYTLRTRVIEQCQIDELRLDVAGRNWSRGVFWTFSKLVHHILIAVVAGRPKIRIRDMFFALRFSLTRRRLKTKLIGYVDSSLDFLSRYKVALVIENESSYVSEKLYTALYAGCQCVYVGPHIETQGLPRNFLFQSTPNEVTILERLREAESVPYSINADELQRSIETCNLFELESLERRNSWIATSIAKSIREKARMLSSNTSLRKNTSLDH